MKKIFIVMLCVMLIFTSCATPPDEKHDPDTEETGKIQDESEKSKYAFKVLSADSFEVSIDQNMADILSAIGEPLQYFEAASCAFTGLDKTYTYAGFVITTRPDGEKDYVNSIFLTDDSVTTPEGLYIGVSADEVISTYGKGTQTETLISYTDGNTTLNFILKNGSVISIEYIPS